MELRDAAHLGGRNTVETEELLKQELGNEQVRFAEIGRAGENLVVNACMRYGAVAA